MSCPRNRPSAPAPLAADIRTGGVVERLWKILEKQILEGRIRGPTGPAAEAWPVV